MSNRTVKAGVAYGVRLPLHGSGGVELYPIDDEEGPSHQGVHGAMVQILELPVALQLDLNVNVGVTAQYRVSDDGEAPALFVGDTEIPLDRLAEEEVVLVFSGIDAGLSD